jgi:hypothetical protein
MADGALDRLNAAVDALTGALDIDDIAALEAAIASVPPALEAVGVAGAWPATTDNKALVKTISEKLDSTRLRVAVLGDLGRRRLDQLALAGVATGSGATYGR